MSDTNTTSQLAASRALIRWSGLSGERFGIAVSATPDGARLTVRFDDGSEQAFAWPSDVLERVSFSESQQVTVLASGEIGVVNGSREHAGRSVYQVNVASGNTITATEDGLRPAKSTDPAARLKSGELDSARKTNLRVAANRLKFAYQHEGLSSLSNSRVELKPHQVGVVHRVAHSYPHRYILADEVGLGKTIEAGLILRELIARGVAKRILILAPSGLVPQWQQELKTKFNLSFSAFNRDTVRLLEGENPNQNVWTVRDLVVASTAFASRSLERREEIAKAGWDAVIIDEAHHARQTSNGPTLLYQLAAALSDPDLARAQAMLLLSATPMQLDRYELYSLIELLDPALFPSYEDFDAHARALRGLNQTVEDVKKWDTLDSSAQQSVLGKASDWTGRSADDLKGMVKDHRGALVEELESKHRLSRVMVRNRKSVVGGFMPRTAAIWEVDLTPVEADAYWATTEYVQEGYAKSRREKNNALGFLMAVFQKLNASSSYALKRSLIRRIARLEAEVTTLDVVPEAIDDFEIDDVTSVDEIDSIFSESTEGVAEEIEHLGSVVDLLERIPLDSKAKVLKQRLAEVAEREADPKVIVFTQFRDTQDYLAEHLSSDWSIQKFHGGLKPEEKNAAVAAFRDRKGPQLLISTEAGGEGRNFQYCHILVNYDLPWNPMKVEQRIGRIDRIGQKHPVLIFNLSTNGTIEERVVEVLTNRIGVFKETIGGLDPILGEVESDLKRIFLTGEEKLDKEVADFESRLEQRVKDARAAESKLADLIMDTRSYRKEEVDDLLEQPRTVNSNHLKRFTLGALQEIGCRIDRRDGERETYDVSLNDRAEELFPDVYRAGRTHVVTFDHQVALEREEVEFLAFGHPIVDGLVERFSNGDLGGSASHRQVLSDEVPPARGWLFTYVLEWSGMTNTRELATVFVHEDGRSDPEVASWLLDRAMSAKREQWPNAPQPPLAARELNHAAGLADSEAITRLLERQATLEEENRTRIATERSKRERFYDYRARAASDKLHATEQTLARLDASLEEADRRILPVWQKNVENAKALVESISAERDRRLGELEGKDLVNAQHHLLSCSAVTIEPDPSPLLNELRSKLSAPLFKEFQSMVLESTGDELDDLMPDLIAHHRHLKAARVGKEFDLDTANALTGALYACLRDSADLPKSERRLLAGATRYFLKVDDAQNDLNHPHGFDDDVIVTKVVFEAIGRTESLPSPRGTHG